MRSRLAQLMRLPLALIVALGLLAQGIAEPPAFASPASDPFWALGGICGPGHASGVPGAPAQDGQHHRCACCQAGPTPFLLPAAPLAAPARAAVSLVLRIEGQAVRVTRLRPAYASRAPPAWG